MGFDLVTWNPVVPSGPNTWDLPALSPILAGSKAFSATPLIAEVNASSYWNQVIGLLNRRILRYNALFGTFLSTSPYINQFDRLKALTITNLQARINALRVAEGFANYVFTSVGIVINRQMLAIHLSECRQALRIAGTFTPVYKVSTGGYHHYFLNNTPSYNTNAGEAYDFTSLTDLVGKVNPNGSVMERFRALNQFNIPEWLTSGIVTAQYKFTTIAVVTSLESFHAKLYSSNTNDITYNGVAELTPAYGGYAYHLNNVHGQTAGNPVVGVNSISMVAATIYARAGLCLCTILGSDLEMANAGSGTFTAGQHSYFQFGSTGGGSRITGGPVIDFGT